MTSLQGTCVVLCALLITALSLPTTTYPGPTAAPATTNPGTPTASPATTNPGTPTAAPATTNPGTPTASQPPGCMKDGIYYPAGFHQEVDDWRLNWCGGFYCDSNGGYVNWDNFYCHPTTTPNPPTPMGCVYQGRVYLVNTVIHASLDHKGNPCVVIHCDSKGNLVQQDNNCEIVG